jgi:hypothetical protein
VDAWSSRSPPIAMPQGICFEDDLEHCRKLAVAVIKPSGRVLMGVFADRPFYFPVAGRPRFLGGDGGVTTFLPSHLSLDN